MREFKTERKVLNIIQENDENYSYDDRVKLFYAFENLGFFEMGEGFDELQSIYKTQFEEDKGVYVEKMRWISDFMKSKGYNDPVFRRPEDYDASREDWNYFYRLKTKSEYEADEIKRKKIIAEYNRAE